MWVTTGLGAAYGIRPQVVANAHEERDGRVLRIEMISGSALIQRMRAARRVETDGGSSMPHTISPLI